jgi:polyisoprenoid-binding protein YceI
MRWAPARAWTALFALALVPILPAAVARAAAAKNAALAPAPTSAPLAIDGARSNVEFLVNLRFRMRATGRISGIGGELRPQPAGGWTVRVQADGRNLRVAGPRWMGRVTRSDDFLAVDRYPDIRFNSQAFSDRILRMGGNVRGQLTLRGLTRPVSLRLLPSACDHPGRDCDLQVQGIISRIDFGMTAYPRSVKDDVEIRLQVRLRPAAAP